MTLKFTLFAGLFSGAILVVLSIRAVNLVGVQPVGKDGAVPSIATHDETALRLQRQVLGLQEEKTRLERLLKEKCSASTSTSTTTTTLDLPAAKLQQFFNPAVTEESEWTLPSMRVETDLQLKRGKWRVERINEKCSGNKLEGDVFLTHDICQLGHIPKDATHLFVHLATGNNLHHIVYGSECMVPETLDPELKVPNYGRTWLAATRHWFDAVIEYWAEKTGKRVVRIFPTGISSPQDTTADPNVLKIHYYDPKWERLCAEKVVTREEKWRWFPGHAAAWAFRYILQSHFKLSIPVKEYGKAPLSVAILKRLEDRRFDEDQAHSFLQSKFGGVAAFRTVVFDNKSLKGRLLLNVTALTYVEQMQLLATTDVFIAAHGAALTSIVCMRRGSAVIELFPNNFRYYMFEELARLMGLHYYSYESPTPPSGCAGCTGRKGTPTLDDIHNFNGAKACKKCNIKVSSIDWFYLFKDAASAVWLSLSRRSDIHKFDVRKQK